MTLYTSDTDLGNKYKETLVLDSYEIIEDEDKRADFSDDDYPGGSGIKYLQTAIVYSMISIVLMIAGAIYEMFSHGVFSFYMIYAFAIPLAGGALPYMAAFLHKLRTKSGHTAGPSSPGIDWSLWINDLSWGYHAGLATLTIGSIMKGVLDIYGTTNRMIIIYPLAGVILIVTALALCARKYKMTR